MKTIQINTNMNQSFNNIITNLDITRLWGLYFQDTASPQMEGLVELHDNIMFYLVIILLGVAWILLSIIRNYVTNKSPISKKYIKHGGEIMLGFILILIAFTFFKFLYLMDEVTDLSLNAYVEESQRYIYPEYIDIVDLDLDIGIDGIDTELDLEDFKISYDFFMNEDVGGEEEDRIEVEYIGGDSGDDSNSPPESSDSEDDSTGNRGVKRTASDANSDSDSLPELIADEGNLSSRELEFTYKLDSVVDVIAELESKNIANLSEDYIAKTAQHDQIVENAAAERRVQLESGEQRDIMNATQNLQESSFNMNSVLLESLRNESWLTADDRAELVGAERTHNECRGILDDIRILREEVLRGYSSDSTTVDTDFSNSSNNTSDED